MNKFLENFAIEFISFIIYSTFIYIVSVFINWGFYNPFWWVVDISTDFSTRMFFVMYLICFAFIRFLLHIFD